MKVTIEKARELIVERLKAKRRSLSTITGCNNALDTFNEYLLGCDIYDLRLVDKPVISGYIFYVRKLTYGRKAKKLSYVTVMKKINYVRNVFSMLITEDLLFSDPFRNIVIVKKTAGLPRSVLTREEVKELFSKADMETYIGFRDRTVFEVLYGTGIRLGELVKLDIYDLDFSEHLIFIRQGKGYKDRIVPCTEIALGFLKEYLDEVRPALCFFNSKERSLFLSVFGVRLTADAFRQAFRGYLGKTNIKKKACPHVLRHTFATHMLEGGANVRYIQEILGHEQLSTTTIYTRVTVSALKKAIKQYHPRENELYEAKEITIPEVETLYRYIKQEEEIKDEESD